MSALMLCLIMRRAATCAMTFGDICFVLHLPTVIRGALLEARNFYLNWRPSMQVGKRADLLIDIMCTPRRCLREPLRVILPKMGTILFIMTVASADL